MLPRSRPGLLAAAAVGLLLSMVVVLPASAAPVSSPSPASSEAVGPVGDARQLVTEAAAGGVASTLRAALGGSFAGAWFEPDARTLFVATTDPAAVPRVHAAGAAPRLVSRNLLTLQGVMAVLNSRASTVPDTVTSWHVDPARNSVVVSATDDAAARAFAAGQDAVTIEHVDARPVLLADLRGGDSITSSSGGRCSVGFNAISDGTRYVITAGHCTKPGGIWSGPDGNAIGPVAGSSFPGSDFGLVEVTSPAWEQTHDVNADRDYYLPVTGTTPAPVGSKVCLSGSTSGYHCGEVKATGQTVNYGNGNVVQGLTGTSVCAEAGDSGGPFMSGTQAQGTLSGGSGGCLLGGQSYFQPIGVVLSTYGLTLLTGGEESDASAASEASSDGTARRSDEAAEH